MTNFQNNCPSPLFLSFSFQPEYLSNLSSSAWLNLSSPVDETGRFDRCRIFDVDFADVQVRPEESTPTVACNLWEFSQEQFQVFHILKCK